MILILLAKVVTFHIGLSIVEIGVFSYPVVFLMTCRFRTTSLTLEKQIHIEIYDPL